MINTTETIAYQNEHLLPPAWSEGDFEGTTREEDGAFSMTWASEIRDVPAEWGSGEPRTISAYIVKETYLMANGIVSEKPRIKVSDDDVYLSPAQAREFASTLIDFAEMIETNSGPRSS